MKSNLKEIKDRLEKATQGMWFVYNDPIAQAEFEKTMAEFGIKLSGKNYSIFRRITETASDFVADAGMDDGKNNVKANADLISHAPEDLRSLLADVKEAKGIFREMLASGGALIWDFEEEIKQFLKEPK
jgi:predicted oxidoreductase